MEVWLGRGAARAVVRAAAVARGAARVTCLGTVRFGVRVSVNVKSFGVRVRVSVRVRVMVSVRVGVSARVRVQVRGRARFSVRVRVKVSVSSRCVCPACVAVVGVVAGGTRGEARAALLVWGDNGGTGQAVGGAAARALGARAWLKLGG